MSRVLIVSFWYAPREHPRALRWSAIAREWAAGGAQVDVLCASSPGRAREERIDGVRVVRVGRAPAPAAAPGRRPGPLASVAQGVWRSVRWPDWACRWYLPARREAIRMLAAGGHDRLVSVSDPFTAHLVGLAAHRARPRVPWLVDIGDPFSPQEKILVNNPRLFGRLNRSVEERVLAASRAVTVTAPSVRERYVAAFPALAPKIAVVPPLCAPPPAVDAATVVFPADGRLRLLWVGTLYRSIRDPGPLLELFRLLLAGPLGDRVELHLMGDTGDCSALVEEARRCSRGRLVAHGVVPRATALAAARQAACLVNVGNATAHQLPSKLAEYAASGRPILNLEGNAADTSREFLAGHPAFLSLPAAVAATPEGAAQVEAFLVRAAAPDRALLAAWLEPCTPGRVAAAYAALLGGVG